MFINQFSFNENYCFKCQVNIKIDLSLTFKLILTTMNTSLKIKKNDTVHYFWFMQLKIINKSKQSCSDYILPIQIYTFI